MTEPIDNDPNLNGAELLEEISKKPRPAPRRLSRVTHLLQVIQKESEETDEIHDAAEKIKKIKDES